MKQINTYINEKLRLTKKPQYTCQPEDKDELWNIIIDRIKSEGPNCDLNDIDTSKITDMSNLFKGDYNDIFKEFNGDISLWDVSNVEDMMYMFYGCDQFNQDLNSWDVSKVKDMRYMFYGCEKFNCDLSKWNVLNVENMNSMFLKCKQFNQDLNSWDVSHAENIFYAFFMCPTTPTWYDRDKCE